MRTTFIAAALAGTVGAQSATGDALKSSNMKH